MLYSESPIGERQTYSHPLVKVVVNHYAKHLKSPSVRAYQEPLPFEMLARTLLREKLGPGDLQSHHVDKALVFLYFPDSNEEDDDPIEFVFSKELLDGLAKDVALTKDHSDNFEETHASPPASLQRILYRLSPKNRRDDIIGDLAEEYQERLELTGKKTADRWYYEQVTDSAKEFAWRWISHAASIIQILETIRRIVG